MSAYPQLPNTFIKSDALYGLHGKLYKLSPIQAQQKQVLYDVLVYLGVYLLLALTLAFYIRRTLVKPLLWIRDAAYSVANGDLDADMQVRSSLPEMLSLGESLNSMRQSLVGQASALKKEALHDRLTGLPNRGAIQELIEREHSRSVRKNDSYTLLMFDLDHFKQVNDNFGHSMGDEVLKEIANLTQEVIRDADVVARWGGEEFLGLLPEMSEEGSITIADRLRRTIEQRNIIHNGRSLSVTVSMGLATFPEDGENWHELLEVADSRLYEAKRSGRNRVISGRESLEGVTCMAEQIEAALKEDKVATVFTPIIDLAERKVIAEQVAPQVEIASGHKISMEQFMVSASQLGLAHEIDVKVMRTALDRCINSISNNQAVTHLVKVSGEFVQHPEVFAELLAFAKERCHVCATGLKQVPLVIELEEKELMGDVDKIHQILSPFIDAGIQIALSGFGRGQNSMQYLADLPVSFLKIAPEMVKKAQKDWRSMAILQGLQATSKKLGVKIVVEGIDDKEMLAFLVDLGVDWGYGALFKV